MSAPALADWMAARLADFERAAEAHLPPTTRKPTKLHAAMRYATLQGGKRVRPLLVHAAGEAMQAPEAALQAAALAVEYVHVYSLIHDDLPCMDNDVLRRGKPTVHIAFDEATAMLAGDALQAEAFRVLAQATVAPAVQAALMGELAEAASTAGMCGGQAIDLDAVGSTMSLDDLEQMHLMKTGALLRAGLRMGARAGGADAAVLADLDAYARAIGLAFQVVDDVLDVEASSAELGKTAGKDAQQGKPTYVSMLGLTEAKAWAERLRRDAHRALDHLPETVRARTLRLRQLADFIVLRKS
jgi:farnesyl diphosphate synthase